MNGATVIDTILRMPRGRTSRQASVTASRRLASGNHRVEEFLLCQSDGAQGADPTAALDEIRWETMLGRAGSGRSTPADPSLFRAGRDWAVN